MKLWWGEFIYGVLRLEEGTRPDQLSGLGRASESRMPVRVRARYPFQINFPGGQQEIRPMRAKRGKVVPASRTSHPLISLLSSS